MATGVTDQEGEVSDSTGTDEQDWGGMVLAILVSVVAALVVHYVSIASISLHPTPRALIGVVLFFIADIVTSEIVLV